MRIEALYLPKTKQIDKQCLVSIYEEHSPGLFRYAYRLLGNRDLAEECVAETFSRFLQGLQKGQSQIDNVQAYIYRMAHHWIADFYRRQPPPEISLDIDTHDGSLNSPDHILDQRFELERVRAALRRLPFVQQRVIEMRFLENRSHEDIAQALGKTVEACRALQYRGLRKMRDLLIGV